MDCRSTNSASGAAVLLGVLLTTAAAGFGASLAPASPLGFHPADLPITVAFAVVLAWALFRASGLLVLPALVVALAATSLPAQSLALLAILAFGIMLTLRPGEPAPTPRRTQTHTHTKASIAVRTVLASSLANVMVRLDDRGHDRLSAYAVGLVVVVLLLGEIRRLGPAGRRTIVVTSFALGIAGSAVVAGSIEELRRLRTELVSVQDEGETAADLLSDGEFEAARFSLEETRHRLSRAQGDLRSGYTGVAMWVPGASQNLRALDFSSQATIELLDASIALAQLGEAPTILDGGRITTNWTSQAEVQVELTLAAGPTRDELRSLDSVWFAPQTATGLQELSIAVDEFRERMGALDDALMVFPRLAGYEGERRYLLLLDDPVNPCLTCAPAAGFALIELDEGAAYPLEVGRLDGLDDRGDRLDDNVDGVIRLGSLGVGDLFQLADPTIDSSEQPDQPDIQAEMMVLRELVSAVQQDRVAMSVADADERRLLTLLGIKDLADPFDAAGQGFTGSPLGPR